MTTAAAYTKGQRVEVEFFDGEWLPGIVHEVKLNHGFFDSTETKYEVHGTDKKKPFLTLCSERLMRPQHD